MSGRIHDDELDTSEATVRALLQAQCPAWADLPLRALWSSGTDNAMWRVLVPDGDDLVVRLPRRARSAGVVAHELEVLRAVAGTSLPIRTPTVVHVGRPEPAFPDPWAVLEWIEGEDAWTARSALEPSLEALAVDVAATVRAIAGLQGMPVGRRPPGERGGPIGPLLERLSWWLTDPRWNASGLLDVAAAERAAATAREVADEPVEEGFVHGDLLPGNLVTRDGHLAAVIDWGAAAWADPAQDLTPAWALFEGRSRAAFREAVGADDASWLRARTFELEHAVGGVLYYVPRGHPLGDVMARTLRRILDEAQSPAG